MPVLVRGSVRASSTTTGPSPAKISSIIGSPATGIRGAASQTRSWREPLYPSTRTNAGCSSSATHSQA